jgi:hypothetical protein
LAGISSVNVQKLEEMLKPHQQATDVLSKALAQVTKEDGEKKVEAAIVLIRKAQGLQDQMTQIEKRFNSEKAKFDKELGKILNSLRNMASGKPIDEAEESTEPEANSSAT